MGNTFVAHLFGRSRRGDREIATLKLFNSDGSPFVMGGVERVYINGEFDFDALPTDQSPIDWTTLPESAVFNGSEIDSVDPTKLWVPSGIYFATIMYTVSVNGTPTYLSASLVSGYDEGDGLIPDPVSAWRGAGTESVGEPVPYNAQGRGDGWGIGSIPFYYQLMIAHDAPDPLPGSIILRVARVAAF